jgi:DNA-binding CsgD family transcriptional regulator
VLARVRGGAGEALVLRGEAGIGKSAVMGQGAADATGMRVLRARGVKGEVELPFAGLHLLFRHDLDLVDGLPEPQAASLRAAFGLMPAGRSDRFTVGLATLSLLDRLAEDEPVLCLVDDAQWLDQSSAGALAFAARRLGRQAVAIVFAVRDEGCPAPLHGLPELWLARLDAPAAARLLAERATDLPAESYHAVIEQAAGNPLALLDLAAASVHAQQARDPLALRTAAGVRQEFLDRIGRLPEAARHLLAVAAADDSRDLDVLVDAVRRMGLPLPVLEEVERLELLRFSSTRFCFRHPLMRVVAYESAPLAVRLAAHHALAGVYERRGDLDCRAGHLAAGAVGVDESTAAELERSAAQATERGSHQAAASAYETAARLSPGSADRGRRLIAAGTSALAARRLERAEQLADQAARTCDGPAIPAGSALIRASVALEKGSPRAAARMLLDAPGVGDDIEIITPLLGEAGLLAWRGGHEEAVREAASRLTGRALPSGHPLHGYRGAVRSLVALLDDDAATALSIMREMVQSPGARFPGRLGAFAADAALLTGDDRTAADLAEALAADCRRNGLLTELMHALQVAAQAHLFLGAVDNARALVDERLRVCRALGPSTISLCPNHVDARLAAIQGDPERCLNLASATPAAGDSVAAAAWGTTALALSDLGSGRYPEAAARLREVLTGPARCMPAAWFALPDLVEAAVRAGLQEVGEAASTRWGRFAENSGQPWARAVAARCRALLAGTDDAGALYADAVRLHQGGGRPFERGRTELFYGEWLRRQRRRTDARRHLRAALEVFDRLAAAPWAERARSELRAAGESVSQAPAADLLGRLTAQEWQVVRLAATGATNREIAARLFLSHRTVGYHLHKAFPKLGVTSRVELCLANLSDLDGRQLVG